MTIQETHYNEQNPAVVVYCYRWMDSAQIHALSVELWCRGQQLAYIKPIHCVGLHSTQINAWCEQAVRELSLAYGVELGELIYSFRVEPTECPLRPCSDLPVKDLEVMEDLSQREVQQGAWSSTLR